MGKAYYAKCSTLLGEMYVASSEKGLCKIALPEEDPQEFFQWLSPKFKSIEESVEKNQQAINQLQEYSKGERKNFNLSIDFLGTAFQNKVWKALMDIPYGSACSYKDIAIKVGSPRGFRAVGMANNKNPIPIVVPCHRVVGHNGALVGYGGGLHMKIRLLELEGLKVNNGKI